MEIRIRSNESFDIPVVKVGARTLAPAAMSFGQALQANLSPPQGATVRLDTARGTQELEPERYFNPPPGTSLDDLPVLLPSAANIQALSRHASDGVARMLADKGIPHPPASMSIDNAGRLQLPADYPYATQFRQALAERPALAREIDTINGLSTVMAELQATQARQDYTPTTALGAGAGNAFRQQFPAPGRPPQISMVFGTDGRLTVTSDGKPLL